MVDFKGKDSEKFWVDLEKAGHWAHEIDGVWQYSDEAAIQAFVDAYEVPMPDLTPRQFYKVMARVGLVPLIREAFALLEGEQNELYDSAYSQYYGGKEFYWADSIEMYRTFYPLFAVIFHQKYGEEIPFVLDEETLRLVWLIAKTL